MPKVIVLLTAGIGRWTKVEVTPSSLPDDQAGRRMPYQLSLAIGQCQAYAVPVPSINLFLVSQLERRIVPCPYL